MHAEIRCLSEFIDSNNSLTETLLDETCDHFTYSLCMSTHLMFRCDQNRACSGQNSGGSTLLLLPKKFNPKIQEDLYFFTSSHFEGIWLEFTEVLNIYAPLEQKFIRNKTPLQLTKKCMNSIDESLRLKKEIEQTKFQSSQSALDYET